MGEDLSEFKPEFYSDIEHLLDQYSTHELRYLIKDIAAAMDKPSEYVPFPKQKVFHECLASTILVCCGNRAGKSQGGARETDWRLLGTHPYKRKRVPIKAWVAGNSYKTIGKVLWPKIKSYLEPRHIHAIKKNSEGYVDRVELINGSTIDFKTYKQDVMDWESEDLDFLWCDEPPPRDHYIAALRGLADRNGDVLITATPLREAWVQEELWQKAGKPGYDIATFQWSSYDNPHTNHDAIRRLERSLTPEEAQTRIYGNFKKLIGRVFKYFEEDGRHVVPAFPWPKGWPYFEGIDPHMSKAHGFIRLGITPRKNAVIFHASRPMGGMEELAKHILQTRPNSESPVMEPVVDTSVNQFDNSIGMTQSQQLASHGIDCILAMKKDQLLAGLERMNQLFYNVTNNRKSHGLYVMDNCIEFIDEAKRLVWDEKKEDTTKGDDDLIDPTRYVIQYDPWEITKAQVVKPRNAVTYSQITKVMHGNGQLTSANTMYADNRMYSNSRFDRDEDDDDKPRYSVRY